MILQQRTFTSLVHAHAGRTQGAASEKPLARARIFPLSKALDCAVIINNSTKSAYKWGGVIFKPLFRCLAALFVFSAKRVVNSGRNLLCLTTAFKLINRRPVITALYKIKENTIGTTY